MLNFVADPSLMDFPFISSAAFAFFFEAGELVEVAHLELTHI